MLPGATAIHCSACGDVAPEWWAAYGRPALCNRCEPEDCPGCGGSGYRDCYAFGSSRESVPTEPCPTCRGRGSR